MAFRYRITDIDKLKDRAVFFDANVLIYLFWPNPQQTWQQKYSLIYGRLLKQKNPLVVNISVLSDSLDFGDKIITLQCKEKQYILLTNDNDFLQSDIDILSVNSKIFTY